MFSANSNINILTVLLREHGVEHIVVCSGSRNAALVRNFVCAGYNCHPVVDERSAGFYALGISVATSKPVAVCVTSGTALLNLSPAVAEAWYRHVPLIVISADRPLEYIGQNTGQTINQSGAIDIFVRKSVSLPLSGDCHSGRFSNRLVNEAMLAALDYPNKPVHINVPLDEPLFDFSIETLPAQRVIRRQNPDTEISGMVVGAFEVLKSSRRPLIVVGQCRYDKRVAEAVNVLREYFVVYADQLSGADRQYSPSSDAFDDDFQSPDLLFYVGDNIVWKFRECFKRATDIWQISPDGEVHDPTFGVSKVLHCDSVEFICALADYCAGKLPTIITAQDQYYASSSAPWYISDFEHIIGESESITVHYGNGKVLRDGLLAASHYIFCNRGTNGIEGSLSTAAGHSLVVDGIVVCVIGDLSFFYDCNALWNAELRGNFRILLINDHRGGIFSKVKGMPQDDINDVYVAGCHTSTARGICESYGVAYYSVTNRFDYITGLSWLLDQEETERPKLLEVLL